MVDKVIKIPGPDHPILIESNPDRVVVRVAGRVVADSVGALMLREAKYPVMQYIPRKDVDMTLLVHSSHTSYCPFKGDCSYFSIPLGGEKAIDSVWTYESPYPSVAVIKDYLSFYASRVDGIEISPR